MKNLPFLLLFLTTLSFLACRPFDPKDVDVDVTQKTMEQLVVPDGFQYSTVTERTLTVTAVDNANTTMRYVPIVVLLRDEDETTPDDTLILAQTDDKGYFETKLALGTTEKKLVIEPIYPGLPPAQVDLASAGNTVSVVLGEDNQADDRASHASEQPRGGITHGPNSMAEDRATYSYMGTYDSQGVPNYLTEDRDIVSQDILSLIANNLPESQPVPQYHPQYIADGTMTSTPLTDSAEVWITFVHEAAGYKNSLGYYTYPTGSTPTTASQISVHRVIFPNLSFTNSGGNMTTGDKVYIGKFPPNTTIGWFLTPDGWTANSQLVTDKNNKPIRYSDRHLNTFTSNQYRNHVAQLVDPNRELILLGFEDLNRPSGDNDFNDAIFYITASPFEAINRNNMVETTIVGADSDDDGVADGTDLRPNDPDVAFRNSYPGLNVFGSFAFEDRYPLKGDYDLNDMVLDYNFDELLNTAQKVVSMTVSLRLRAMGASFRNGFGVELPIPSSKVASVTGASRTDNFITLNSNGTEAGQGNAVIICFDNGYDLLRSPDGGFVNTDPDRPILSPYVQTIEVVFTEPIPRSEIGYAPYNPFIFINRNRPTEVHLPGGLPTDLANTALFGTGDDDTNLSTGKTYMTVNNLPWALNFPASFPYLKEKIAINQGFLKFNQWAESGGTLFSDWYQDKSGYRNTEKIF